MKSILFTSLFLIPLALESADTPSKWGGIFGFGSSKQKGDQISADLFPTATSGEVQSSTSPPPVASPVPAATEDSIFRSGEPQKVEPVSYAIQNGQKVEQEVEKKKSSIFSFGKRNDSGPTENEVLPPVPIPTTAVPIQTAPIVAVPNPAPIQPTPAAELAAAPTAAPVASPPAETEQKESRFSWIPFLSRKKEETPAPISATPVAAPVATPMVSPAASNEATASAATETAKPVAAVTETGDASFEVPKKDEQAVEKAKGEGGGILAPIANLRPPRKPIDLTNAETIIQDGEIVASSETSFDAAPSAPAAAERRPPAVVNGVKTYSSWDDVGGQSTSAADRIINQIR